MAKKVLLYHGSYRQNLKVLKPMKSEYGKRNIYATSELVFAVVFLSPNKNKMQSTCRLGGKNPYFCERTEGIFDKWYSGLKGSIYILPKKDFVHLNKSVYVSEKKVHVLKEIKIRDTKEFLLNLEKQKKFRIIYYKDRKKIFPDDNDLIMTWIKDVPKWGVKATLKNIHKLQPKLERKFLKKLKEVNSKENAEKQHMKESKK